MHADVKPLKLVVIITDRGRGNKTIQFLNDNGFAMHTANLGRGTAPDEFAAALSLGEKEKIVISVVADCDRTAYLMDLFRKRLAPREGIVFSVPLSSISNMEVLKFLSAVNDGDAKQ